MQEYSYVQELSYKWLHLEAYVAAVRMEGFDFSLGEKKKKKCTAPFFQFKESLVFPFEKILLSSSGGEALLQFLRKKKGIEEIFN